MKDYDEYLSKLLEYARQMNAEYLGAHYDEQRQCIKDEFLPPFRRMMLVTAKLSTELINLQSEL